MVGALFFRNASGTVATDGIAGRSVILTAAHCVYDHANKAFARHVLFIPDQTDTTDAGTDLNCGNDLPSTERSTGGCRAAA
jgi:V8-like Glu-specific endopeptidase